ncbi:hypothetical protein GCM10009839_19160 [Catenulispora yoronensis]|uniref:Uncharacterized protein n=1 Tax=Catenulispora yoronensis TaxID=450799 RepID=A0ABN2TW45_9ACTN
MFFAHGMAGVAICFATVSHLIDGVLDQLDQLGPVGPVGADHSASGLMAVKAEGAYTAPRHNPVQAGSSVSCESVSVSAPPAAIRPTRTASTP